MYVLVCIYLFISFVQFIIFILVLISLHNRVIFQVIQELVFFILCLVHPEKRESCITDPQQLSLSAKTSIDTSQGDQFH